jgi:hypothetical protein
LGPVRRVKREGGDGFDEAGSFEPAEDVGDCAWWVAPGVGGALDGAVGGLTVDVDLVEDELVGVFGLDVPAPQGGAWEVVEVGGDDELGAGSDGGGEYVPVVRIG